MFKEGQLVTGLPDTEFEFHKGLIIDTDAEFVLISVTECEYDDSKVGEEQWVEVYDLTLIEDLNYSSTTTVGEVPKMDVNQALVLGII